MREARSGTWALPGSAVDDNHSSSMGDLDSCVPSSLSFPCMPRGEHIGSPRGCKPCGDHGSPRGKDADMTCCIKNSSSKMVLFPEPRISILMRAARGTADLDVDEGS